MNLTRLTSVGPIITLGLAISLTACGGGSENTVSLSDQGSGNNTSPPSGGNPDSSPAPAPSPSGMVYLAVQSVDTDGNVSSNPPEVSTAATTGDTVTLVWESPVTNSDGSCMNDLQSYRLSYGSSSQTYGNNVDISLTANGLACSNSAVHACGNIQTCRYTLTLG